MKLSTERLTLRPVEPNDAIQLAILANDYAIADTTIVIPYPCSQQDMLAWIMRECDLLAAKRGYGFCVLHDSKPIGVTTLDIDLGGNWANLAYWIGKSFWGQGFATEAAKKTLDFGFENLHLNRVMACCMSRNSASRNVLRKLGMQYEGTLRQHWRKWDKYEDAEIFGLIQSEV